ncbi:MAG: zf-HC2 domain-containing protein [Candidatus Zixiibacteriota bacterium]
MNCQDALDLLYEIIDKEASEINTNQVKEHLEKCRHCFEVYRLEDSIQQLINEKVKTLASTPKQENLKSKIINQLNEIDRQSTSKGSTLFFNKTIKTFLIAASLILVIGGGLLLSEFYEHYNNYIPLERAHWADTNDIHAVGNSSEASRLILSLKDNYNYNLLDTVSDFHLIGGDNEEIMGVGMDHFIYTNDKNIVVTVFIAPSDLFEIPSDLKDLVITRDNISLFDHHCRGCRLVYHQTGPVVVITATTNNSVDLLGFIPGFFVI